MAVVKDENGKPLRHLTLDSELVEKLVQFYLSEKKKKSRSGSHVTQHKRPSAVRHGGIAPCRGGIKKEHIRSDASRIIPLWCPVHSKIVLVRASNIPKPTGSNTRNLPSIQLRGGQEDIRRARIFHALLQKELKEQTYWRFQYQQLKMLMSRMARAGAQQQFQQVNAGANKEGTKQ